MDPWMLLVGCLFLMLIGAVWAIVMVLVFRFAVAVFAVEVAAIAALVNPSLRRANPRAVCPDDDDEIAARHHLHDL